METNREKIVLIRYMKEIKKYNHCINEVKNQGREMWFKNTNLNAKSIMNAIIENTRNASTRVNLISTRFPLDTIIENTFHTKLFNEILGMCEEYTYKEIGKRKYDYFSFL